MGASSGSAAGGPDGPSRLDQAGDDPGSKRERAPAVTRVEPPPSLSEHVCRFLRSEILASRLVPGERLTEAIVMERTGVSRTPVRDGIRRLEAEGLVVSLRGRGTYVSSRLLPAEARLVYECRLRLEPYLARLAAERMSDEGLDAVRDLVERFCEVSDTDPRGAGQLDADFHLAIYEASQSALMPVLRSYWSRLQLELSERVYLTEMPHSFAQEHIGIREALELRDGDLAEQRMRDHVRHGQQVMEMALADAASVERSDSEVERDPR